MLSDAVSGDLREKFVSSVGLTNKILSDPEELLAQELLQETNQTISSIDPEIAQLHSTLRGLQDRRAREMELIMRLQVGLSPQKRVPSELLGLIFESCADDDEDYKVEIPLHPRSECLTLSQVCSRWRRIALAEPSLWNRVLINYPNRVRSEPLETVLLRAGNAISFHLSVDYIPQRVRRIIHQYSNKFRKMELTIDLSLHVQRLKMPLGPLDALQELRVNILNDPDNLDEIAALYPAIASFADAPSIRKFDVHPIFDNPSIDVGMPRSFKFPWSNLHNMNISTGTTLVGFLHIFVQCTRLVSCDVVLDREEDIASTYTETRWGVTTANLKNLRSLKLTSYGVNLNSVLDCLIAPSLRVLKLKNFHTVSDTLLQFIHRSKCNIQKIDINLTPNLSPHIDRLIHAIPNAITLRFRGINTLSTATLDSLGARELLPNLEVLECYVSSCRAVRDFVSHRCVPGNGNVMREFTA